MGSYVIWETRDLMGCSSTSSFMDALRGDYQKVEWRRLTCNNAACPKWIFILYLALQSRLLTRDRVATWGCVEDVHCVLCGTEDESHNRIFFRCLFSSQVWQKVLCWQSIHREARGWEEEITWVNAQCKGKHARAEERNQRIFQKITKTPAMLAKQVAQEVHMRGRTKPRLSYVLQTLNFYPV
ncbi:hypothetical protein KY285_009970 [Solanum tuberosum]|nr:hypothetical protein KY285_009970 [Solanum tuberosum]